jgi:signal peptidase I
VTASEDPGASGAPQAPSPERDPSAAAPEPPEPGPAPRRWSRSVRLWAALLSGTLLAAVATSAWVVQPFLIPSGSMEGTLRVGDRVLVNKLAYRFGHEVQRGDIIVFDGAGTFAPEAGDRGFLGDLLNGAAAAVGLGRFSDTDYVKRVIGVGGDRVRCCDSQGRIEVNGEPLDEPYLYPGDEPSTVEFDIVVPEGRLWVMGDHRSDSADSRQYLGSPGGGTVPVNRVIGRVEWIGWPLGRLGSPADGDG